LLEDNAMVSVIVPAYRAPSLSSCVEALLAQQLDEPFEVIVCASADSVDELPQLPDDSRLKVLTHVPRLAAAAARNRAVAVSGGRLLAFADADVLARPGWLTALVQASEGRYCTAGSVLNGTPRSSAGTVEYLVEFLDLHPARPSRTLWHGATCNLLIPRGLWREFGPFPEDLGGGEDTLLTVAARSRGLFRFAPEAAVVHQNRTSWVAVIRHQVEFGRFTARLVRRSPYRARVLVRYPPLAPLAFLARWASIYARAARWDGRLLAKAVVLAPGVIVLLVSWTVGLVLEGVRLDAVALRHRRKYGPAS
jgi:glycosyltransferase involved in cell wall biosynthesis